MDKIKQRFSYHVNSPEITPRTTYVTHKQDAHYFTMPLSEEALAVHALVSQCFTRHRRIFVICADLLYRAESADQVSVDLAERHHADFVNRLRGLAKIRKNLIDAISKLGWAETVGHCFRWVFMFDGDQVQGAWEYEELVDDLWTEIVPKGAGDTLVLNGEAHMMAGTGMIDLDENPEKFEIFVESIIR